MFRRHSITVLVATAALAAAPATALSQTGGYPRVSDVDVTNALPFTGGGGGGGGAGQVAGAQAAGGELPFTGLDLGFVALAGAVLMAAGFGLRQLHRQPEA